MNLRSEARVRVHCLLASHFLLAISELLACVLQTQSAYIIFACIFIEVVAMFALQLYRYTEPVPTAVPPVPQAVITGWEYRYPSFAIRLAVTEL